MSIAELNNIQKTIIQLYLTPRKYGESDSFYDYICKAFDDFINEIGSIDNDEITRFIQSINDFQGNKTKWRFINFIKRICRDLKKILKDLYLPNQSFALKRLEALLGTNNRKLMQYIDEQLVNYFEFKFDISDSIKILYRIRDCALTEVPCNCWHIPFESRSKAYTGRFSLSGFPCLYLSENKETCQEEVGELANGKSRWIGEFTLKENKTLICIDLCSPTEDGIYHMSNFELFQAILMYPFWILSCTKAKNPKDPFNEEYLFSQALINLITYPISDNSGMVNIHGIRYDSTKQRGGINYALPAISQNYPPSKDEPVSQRLKDLFNHNKPQKLE